MGTVTDGVATVLGGARLSGAQRAAFAQILAGLARSSQKYRNVNENGFGESAFDGLRTLGSVAHLPIQVGGGVDLKVGARAGIRLEGGRDLLTAGQAFLGPPRPSPHLRLLTSVVVRFGRP
jgi:hypothetical protein